jgi:asparagine N-glycosylation enzyme membrane subunit Stt3
MERALEIYAIIQLTVIGLSHVVQHRAWAEFFIWLRTKGDTGVFANGFLSLLFGSIIVAFHPVWSGIPLILTVLGVLQVFKATLCFLVPSLSTRSMNRVSLEKSRMFVAPGLIFVVIAAVLTYGLARGA